MLHEQSHRGRERDSSREKDGEEIKREGNKARNIRIYWHLVPVLLNKETIVPATCVAETEILTPPFWA